MFSVTWCMCPSSFLLKCELSNVIFVLVINYLVAVRNTSCIYKAHRYKFFLVLSLLEIREDHVETTYWIRYSAVLLISHKNSFQHLNSVLRMCRLFFNSTTWDMWDFNLPLQGKCFPFTWILWKFNLYIWHDFYRNTYCACNLPK